MAETMSENFYFSVGQTLDDLEKLRNRELSLQVAIGVADQTGSSKPPNYIYNTVWKAETPARETSFKWTDDFALGYTVNKPKGKVIKQGSWQPCGAGGSYRLDSAGAWYLVTDNSNANQKCLNVTANQLGQPIYIIVGIKKKDADDYDPVWFSETSIPDAGSGSYQPSSKVQLWYQKNPTPATTEIDISLGTANKEINPNKPWYFWYLPFSEWKEGSSNPLPSQDADQSLIAFPGGIHHGHDDDYIPLFLVRKGIYFRHLDYYPGVGAIQG